MDLWGSILMAIAPERALKRHIFKERIKRFDRFRQEDGDRSGRRSFEAISGGRTRYDFLTTSQGPDAAIRGDIAKLRNHVRQMEYNNGFISGPIRRIVRNVVGQGLRFQARVKPDERAKTIPRIDQAMAEDWNHEAERNFAVWNKQADKRLMFSFYELQAIVEGALLRDNECLVIGRISNRPGRLIPYCLDVYECDRLRTPISEINNPKIRNGILFGDEGVPEKYFILKNHPGEGLAGLKDDDFEEVDAFNPNGTRKVLHMFNPLRPEQTRGFTAFAPGLKDLQDLERYMEAEKMAALEAACLTGTVETQHPEGFLDSTTTAREEPEGYEPIREFGPGMVHYLNKGEKFTLHNPTRPNESFGVYLDQLMRGPSNALDIPPEVFSQDWKGFNYSNARTVLLQFWGTCVERQAYLRNHLCIPVWENVARHFVVKGLVPPRGFDRRPEDFLRSAWIPAVYRRWVDPLKESKGRENDVNNNFDTLTDVCAEQGKDIDEVLEARARELKRIKELEEKHGIKFPKAGGGGGGGAGEGEEGMEDPDAVGSEFGFGRIRRVR